MAMSDILKEYSDILMNKKVWVRNLEENKVVLLVLYWELKSPWHSALLTAIYMVQV